MNRRFFKKLIVLMMSIALLFVFCSCSDAKNFFADTMDEINEIKYYSNEDNQKIPSTDEKGVKLGFDGDYVYLEIYGTDLLQAVEYYAKNGNQYGYVTLAFGYSKPYSGSVNQGFEINPDNPDESSMDDHFFQYTGGDIWGPCLICSKKNYDSLKLWFYAPGFEAAVKEETEYCLECLDDKHHFSGVNGNVEDILGDYVSYEEYLPELPSEFDISLSEVMEVFDTFVTPNYLIIQRNYLDIPVSTDFDWYPKEDGTGYDYMAGKLLYDNDAPESLIEINIYDSYGRCIGSYSKCIYGSKEDAVASRIYYLDSIQTAEEPYGTEEDYEEWKREYLTSSSGFHSQDDNVVYFHTNYIDITESAELIYEFDDETEELFDSHKSSAGENTLETGKFDYRNLDIHFEYDGEQHRTYVVGHGDYYVYSSFNMKKVVKD